MHPRLITFACIFSGLFWLALIFALCSCSTDPNAGMVAARDAGMPRYISFDYAGEQDSAAVLPFRGEWWFYHPSIGSRETRVSTASRPPNFAQFFLPSIANPHWEDVRPEPRHAELAKGCLPIALADHRLHGGRLYTTRDHVQNLR